MCEKHCLRPVGIAALAACLVVPNAARALSPGSTILVPAAARVGNWYTDLIVYNNSQSYMTIDVCWLTRGQSNPHPPCETITLSGRKYQVFEDVIYRTFGMNSGTGAFLVRVQQNKDDLVCTARIYSKQGSRTFGQGFEGVPVSLAPQAYSQNDIPGIASNNSFRTNWTPEREKVARTQRMQVKNNQAGWAYTTVHLGAYEPKSANISQLFTFPEPLADGNLELR